MTDKYTRVVKYNPKYEHPPMVKEMECNEIVEDTKEKRLKAH